jgi:hypothetical protein
MKIGWPFRKSNNGVEVIPALKKNLPCLIGRGCQKNTYLSGFLMRVTSGLVYMFTGRYVPDK